MRCDVPHGCELTGCSKDSNLPPPLCEQAQVPTLMPGTRSPRTAVPTCMRKPRHATKSCDHHTANTQAPTYPAHTPTPLDRAHDTLTCPAERVQAQPRANEQADRPSPLQAGSRTAAPRAAPQHIRPRKLRQILGGACYRSELTVGRQRVEREHGDTNTH